MQTQPHQSIYWVRAREQTISTLRNTLKRDGRRVGIVKSSNLADTTRQRPPAKNKAQDDMKRLLTESQGKFDVLLCPSIEALGQLAGWREIDIARIEALADEAGVRVVFGTRSAGSLSLH